MPDLFQPLTGDQIIHVTMEQLSCDLVRRLKGNQIIYLWPSKAPNGTEGTPTTET